MVLMPQLIHGILLKTCATSAPSATSSLLDMEIIILSFLFATVAGLGFWLAAVALYDYLENRK